MAAQGNDGEGEMEVLQYPVCTNVPSSPAWNGWVEADEASAAGSARQRGIDRPHGVTGEMPEGSDGELAKKSFEAGRQRGHQEGRQAEREAQAARQAQEEGRRKQQFAALVTRFSEETNSYLHAVEQEIVKLALVVAARILRRDAQMDPLLLTGAVRVALGQLAASSEVRLQVPAAESDLWTETIALLPNLAVKPVVMPVAGMRVGDCVIESKVGTVDLGIRSQLAEIERGFFDRAGSAGSHETRANTGTDGIPLNAADGQARA